jgi:hypothetical protein
VRSFALPPQQMYNLPYGGRVHFLTCFPACPMPLSSRFSRLVVFLVYSDVLTFSAVFNGFTVTSTVTFGEVESASCGLLCTPGCAIRFQTLVVASLLPLDCAGRTPGKPDPQHMCSSFPAGHYRRYVQRVGLSRRVHCAAACTSELKASSE